MPSSDSAVILVNLGTPDAPTPGAVRRYLKQFLSDPRVVEAPRWVWFFVLRLIILPFRPRRVARLYQSVWGDDSPIRTITRDQARGVQARLDIPVYDAMTYGHPCLRGVLDKLADEGVQDLVILPLYPQYSGSTTGAVADVVAKWMCSRREIPTIHLLKDYWQDARWQDALASSIADFRARHGEAEKLLFSFHGIPQSYQDKGDQYGRRCLQTAEQVAARLGLNAQQWHATFQSRFGRQPWLQPYTDETLAQWGRDGVRSVQVVCPGFAADCLETLEEIAEENREIFESNGGGEYAYIPALNTSDAHLDALAAVCRKVLPR